MRVPRIFQNQTLSPFSRITLDEHASRHLLTVLRLEKGHKIILFNGDGYEYPAEIVQTKRHSLEVKIKESIAKNFESPLKIHLGQVVTKGEKMDYILQKATELGVTNITPLFSTRAEVRLKGDRSEKKMEHWQKVLFSACEQCGRNRIPVLNPPLKLPDWVAARTESINLVLDHRSERSLKSMPLKNPVAILVGPEGGLTFEEKMLSERHGFTRVHLGPRILRAETAGLVAVTLLQALAGDLEVRSPSPLSTAGQE